jgi:hypothetical protein
VGGGRGSGGVEEGSGQSGLLIYFALRVCQSLRTRIGSRPIQATIVVKCRGKADPCETEARSPSLINESRLHLKVSSPLIWKTDRRGNKTVDGRKSQKGER